MADPHIDRPGEVTWMRGYGPLPVLGHCPHKECPHQRTATVAWGPDFDHYCLIVCIERDGCNGSCRGWFAEYPPAEALRLGVSRWAPPRSWVHVQVPVRTEARRWLR